MRPSVMRWHSGELIFAWTALEAASCFITTLCTPAENRKGNCQRLRLAIAFFTFAISVLA
jgi:hypothetical protein